MRERLAQSLLVHMRNGMVAAQGIFGSEYGI
jgi:hypothetical protein